MATHETGVSNANVNNLILYIQSTRELHDQLNRAFKECEAGEFKEGPFAILFWDAIDSYKGEFPSNHLEGEDLKENRYLTAFTAEQQNEFMYYYRLQLQYWIRDNKES